MYGKNFLTSAWVCEGSALKTGSHQSWCMDHLIGLDIKVDERIISIKMQRSSSNRVRLPRVNHKILRVGVNILIFLFSPLAR